VSKKKGKVGKPAAAGRATAAEAKKPEAAEAKKAKVPKAERPSIDVETLRRPGEDAKARLDKAQTEAKSLTVTAHALVAKAIDARRAALAPYREACHKAGVECEYDGGRSTNVSEKVSFLVEKTDKGVRVMVKGQPKTEEMISFAALKESINKAAYSYTERHLGPKEEIGNKGGSLSNRLRAVLQV
jgi:hypothetical protein